MAATGTLEQRMAALERANATKLARACTRRWIRDCDPETGKQRAIEVLLDPPPHVATMMVHELLCIPYGMSATKATRLLRRVDVRETRLLGELTVRQGLLVAAELRPDTDAAQLQLALVAA